MPLGNLRARGCRSGSPNLSGSAPAWCRRAHRARGGTAQWEDPDLLDRATALGRVLFSQDEDLLVEAAQRQRGGIPFRGVIYVPQLALSIGQFIEELDLLAPAGVPGDFANRVQYPPLR